MSYLRFAEWIKKKMAAPPSSEEEDEDSTDGTVSGLQFGMEPSSAHTGSMVAGMTDGSVRLVSPGLSQVTWGYACNPADGMPLGSDW